MTTLNSFEQFTLQVPFLLYGLMIPLAIVSFMVEKIVYKFYHK